MSWNSRIDRIASGWGTSIEEANHETAQNIARKAKVNIPKDSGRTAGTIEVLHEGEDRAVVVGFPGHFLEFGTVKMAARPFLSPAAESERAGHALRVKRALNERS